MPKSTDAVIQLPDGTQATKPEYPLFKTPDGTILAVLANPQPNQEPDDTPWQELANRVSPTTDQLAIKLSHLLHITEKPEATILFGSRAKGNHQEPHSDVDIMMVTNIRDNSPLNSRAKQAAKRIYGRDVTVEVLCHSRAELEQLNEYRNTATTEALLYGIVIADDPSQYISRYAGDDPVPIRYSWEPYKILSQEAKDNLDMMLSAHYMKQHGNNPLTKYVLTEWALIEGTLEAEASKDQITRTHAPDAIKKALQAAISATGRLAPKHGTAKQLHGILQTITPTARHSLLISPEEYDTMQSADKIDRRRIVERTEKDVENIRRTATWLYRRTKKATEG